MIMGITCPVNWSTYPKDCSGHPRVYMINASVTLIFVILI
jgi:hypothetical protein